MKIKPDPDGSTFLPPQMVGKPLKVTVQCECGEKGIATLPPRIGSYDIECPKCGTKFAYQRFCPSCWYYLTDEEYENNNDPILDFQLLKKGKKGLYTYLTY